MLASEVVDFFVLGAFASKSRVNTLPTRALHSTHNLDNTLALRFTPCLIVWTSSSQIYRSRHTEANTFGTTVDKSSFLFGIHAH